MRFEKKEEQGVWRREGGRKEVGLAGVMEREEQVREREGLRERKRNKEGCSEMERVGGVFPGSFLPRVLSLWL